MKIDPRKPAHWVSLTQQLIYCAISIVARLLLGKPDKPHVVLYGHQLSGNLNALYEEWQQTHRDKFDCYFLSLDPAYCQTLERSGINLLRCSSLRDMVLVGRSSVIITDHGLHAMSILTRFTDIVFIDVWHGIPFKGFTPDDFRLQHRYREVWVSSPLLKDLYANQFGFPEHIVHPLGYARTDKLFQKQKPHPAFRSDNAIPANNKVVLYAPTGRQDDKGRALFPFNESQDSFIHQLSEVCFSHNATLIIRSHLNASISTRIFDNVRYCSMGDYADTEDLLLQTDVLICDWSSIAFDFLALSRPTIFLDVPPPFKNGFSLGKDYRFGKIVADMPSLLETFAETLDDPQAYFRDCAAMHETITKKLYTEGSTGQSASRQLRRVENLINDEPL